MRNFTSFQDTADLYPTRAAERSYEDPKLSTGFGIFTYFLIQGIMGNADNDPCDGIITADELIEYVRGEVRSYARARNVSQTPQDQGDVDYRKIILAAHPACISGLVTQGIPLGSIVVESNMDNVDVYLDETFVGKVDTKTPLLIPGLSTGSHTVKGVREGYEPDTKQELVIQGQRHTVSCASNTGVSTNVLPSSCSKTVKKCFSSPLAWGDH